MRGSPLLLALLLAACGSPTEEPTPRGPVPLAELSADTESLTNGLGASVLVPTLAALDDGTCEQRTSALRRRMLAVGLLYDGVPTQALAPGSLGETLPAVDEPPGEEFAKVEYAETIRVAADGAVSAAPSPGNSVLLSVDRNAPGDAVRAALRQLRDADAPYVGLLYRRPIAGREPLEPSAALAARLEGAEGPRRDLVFDKVCPATWSLADAAAPAKRGLLWIELATRAYSDCDCEPAARDVAWLHEQTLARDVRVAIPIDVRGDAGARPLVIGEGRPWGPAAKALYNAIRIDPVRPRGTPVVINLDASAPTMTPELLKAVGATGEPPPP